MRLIAIAPLAGFAVLLLAFGVGLANTSSQSEMVGQPAPDFSLPGLTAGERGLSLSDLRGEGPVVVNVFASWCAPCRAEHPYLLALAEGGAPVYGVAWRDGGEASRSFLTELGDPFRATGLDANGRWGDRYSVQGAPETFIIGPDGVVALHWRGAIDAEAMRRVIRPALAALDDE